MILTIKSFAFIIPKYSNEYNFPSLTPLVCGNTVDDGHAGRTNSMFNKILTLSQLGIFYHSVTSQ